MSGIRTRARGFALQLLYALDVNANAEMQDIDAEQKDLPVESKAFAQNIFNNVRDNQDEIDDQLQEVSKNWRLSRMSMVDRNILRLATAELMFDASVPTRVIINEAIELAKRFGTTESASFVNGIVDKVASVVRPDSE